MTGDQIELVQESFAHVLPAAAGAAHTFYDRLFTLAPETRALFHGDIDDQGRKLFLTLAAVVDALDQFDKVVPVARALAIRHVGYGVEERHYSIVGVALIETLRGALGARFDPETEAAWASAYAILSSVMISAANETASVKQDVAA
ncbi:MAG: globin family protein [Sphingomonas phyllosphaerae]